MRFIYAEKINGNAVIHWEDSEGCEVTTIAPLFMLLNDMGIKEG